MELRLPDEVIQGLDLSEGEWLLHLAIGLYVDQRVTLGRAAEIARISKPAFLDELGRRRIPINYSATDLQSDLETIARLRVRACSHPT